MKLRLSVSLITTTTLLVSVFPLPTFANSQETAIKPIPTSWETASAYFEVMYDVPLIPQQTDMSCWAAGAAMLVAWRDRISFDPSNIAKATGYWQQYREGLDADNTVIFPVFGMVVEPAQTYSVEEFKQLLETYSPLWVASAEPGSHIRVVRGIRGDGTPSGTYIYINDPWERGMKKFRSSNRGSQYWETYAEFVKKQETLARRELNVQGIYVAHLRSLHGNKETVKRLVNSEKKRNLSKPEKRYI